MDTDDNHAEENQRHMQKQRKTQAFDRPATQHYNSDKLSKECRGLITTRCSSFFFLINFLGVIYYNLLPLGLMTSLPYLFI